ncbi:DUF4870 domain-containing protein [soil metagenome]
MSDISSFEDPTGEERALAIVCHLVPLILASVCLNLLMPIIIMCISDSPFVKNQAKEALNFQISVVIWAIVSFALCFIVIGIPMLIFLAIAAIVLPILATISAYNGTRYRYPLTFRFIK